MVIGNGDVASALIDKPGMLYFASGVSNSQELRESEYRREVDLLLEQDKTLHVVYFSTLASLYSDTRYTRHKRHMEGIVKSDFPKYTIVRLGNILWGTNPHTLINYLRAHPEAEVRDEYRYVVGKEEFSHWIELIPDWSCEMNIPGERLKVREVKEKYCV